jgi:hypothetical protein
MATTVCRICRRRGGWTAAAQGAVTGAPVTPGGVRGVAFGHRPRPCLGRHMPEIDAVVVVLLRPARVGARPRRALGALDLLSREIVARHALCRSPRVGHGPAGVGKPSPCPPLLKGRHATAVAAIDPRRIVRGELAATPIVRTDLGDRACVLATRRRAARDLTTPLMHPAVRRRIVRGEHRRAAGLSADTAPGEHGDSLIAGTRGFVAPGEDSPTGDGHGAQTPSASSI